MGIAAIGAFLALAVPVGADPRLEVRDIPKSILTIEAWTAQLKKEFAGSGFDIELNGRFLLIRKDATTYYQAYEKDGHFIQFSSVTNQRIGAVEPFQFGRTTSRDAFELLAKDPATEASVRDTLEFNGVNIESGPESEKFLASVDAKAALHIAKGQIKTIHISNRYANHPALSLVHETQHVENRSHLMQVLEQAFPQLKDTRPAVRQKLYEMWDEALALKRQAKFYETIRSSYPETVNEEFESLISLPDREIRKRTIVRWKNRYRWPDDLAVSFEKAEIAIDTLLAQVNAAGVRAKAAHLVRQAAVAKGALADWMNLEQTYIDRTVDPEKIASPTIANQQVDYRPESGQWFKVKTAWIPEHELNVAILENMIPAKLRGELVRVVNGERQYRLFVHPESEKFYSQLLSRYPATTTHEATATASSRTVLMRALNDPAKEYFVKLSLDVELSGIVRTVSQQEVVRSVGTTQYIREIQGTVSPRFKIMPEVAGISPKGWKRGGQIVRLIPEEITKDKTRLVPLFSLYARGANSQTLLESMAASSNENPTEFFVNRILKPFHEAWADWAIRGSIVMEAHAQNVLLEVSNKGVPTGRFFHRDMGGFSIDTESPLFDPSIKDRLPVFTDFETDYHRYPSRESQTQSLTTFFEGGFLFNMDKELQRLDPNYVPETIFRISRNECAQAIRTVGNLPQASVTGEKVLRTMPEVLRRARSRLANHMPPEGRGDQCLRLLLMPH